MHYRIPHVSLYGSMPFSASGTDGVVLMEYRVAIRGLKRPIKTQDKTVSASVCRTLERMEEATCDVCAQG